MLLAIEPMLNKLHSCIEGFKLGNVHNVQHQISAYADDVMILINEKKDDINLRSTVNEFGVISAVRVNWEKSDARIGGKWKNGLPLLPGGFIWKKGGVKYCIWECIFQKYLCNKKIGMGLEKKWKAE